jgi:8-oxo-dGTP diphosphatase
MESIDVAVVILLDGPRMLVNRRPEGGYFGGWWEWPGGKRHEGESFEQCARRELLEEIGLQALALHEYDRRVVNYPGRVVNLVFFTGNPVPGMQASPDALEHAWLTPAEVRKLKFLEPNLPVLEKVERDLKSD